ncbi:MAG: type II toxin-antitoxin system prevent-host-death family antitoxin [Thioploca sp.]|nr:type II toxin-antitoxin system prevent-host-death family antitoxin [Thioploca sp.]
MKTINLEQTSLQNCIKEAQQERVIITENGKPIALLIGIESMDEEQWQLGNSDEFWQLMTERRTQKTISREQLEQKLANLKQT